MKDGSTITTEKRTAVLWIDANDMHKMLGLADNIEVLENSGDGKVAILILIPKGVVVPATALKEGFTIDNL